MGVAESGQSMKLGRISVDNTYIDCALVLHQFPGGCMLEVAHREPSTFCFVDELSDAVLIAFSDEVDRYKVYQAEELKKVHRFLELNERLLLLMPLDAFRLVEEKFVDLGED